MILANQFSSSVALTIRRGGYTTHVGYDNGSTIIRATKGAQILELIPRHIFQRANLFDLPADLVDECFHWLYVYLPINFGDVAHHL